MVQVGTRLSRRIALSAAIAVFALGISAFFFLIAPSEPTYVAETKQNIALIANLSHPLDSLRAVALKLAPPLVSDAALGSGKKFHDAVTDLRATLGMFLLALGVIGLVRMLCRRQFLLPLTAMVAFLALFAIRGMDKMPDRYLLPVGPIMTLAVLCGLLTLLQGALAARDFSRLIVAIFNRPKRDSSFRFDLPTVGGAKRPALATGPAPRSPAPPAAATSPSRNGRASSWSRPSPWPRSARTVPPSPSFSASMPSPAETASSSQTSATGRSSASLAWPTTFARRRRSKAPSPASTAISAFCISSATACSPTRRPTANSPPTRSCK